MERIVCQIVRYILEYVLWVICHVGCNNYVRRNGIAVGIHSVIVSVILKISIHIKNGILIGEVPRFETTHVRDIVIWHKPKLSHVRFFGSAGH